MAECDYLIYLGKTEVEGTELLKLLPCAIAGFGITNLAVSHRWQKATLGLSPWIWPAV